MKLFVWQNVLTDYTDGVMFAYANNVKEARKMVLLDCDYVGKDLDEEPVVYDKPVGFAVWGGG